MSGPVGDTNEEDSMTMTWSEGQELEAWLREKLPEGWAVGATDGGLVALGWPRCMWVDVYCDGQYRVTEMLSGRTWGWSTAPRADLVPRDLAAEIIDSVSEDGVVRDLRHILRRLDSYTAAVGRIDEARSLASRFNGLVHDLDDAIRRLPSPAAAPPLSRVHFDPDGVVHHCPRCAAAATVFGVNSRDFLVCKPCRWLWPVKRAA